MFQRDDLIRAFAEHYDTLRVFAERRVQSPELAADIVQDAYLRLLQQEQVQSVDNPLAFFYRIVGNLVIDRLRERTVRERYADTDAIPEDVADQTPGSDRQIEGRQRLELLARAVDELPPRCREVFILRKIRNLEYDDIAARLGISRNMVEKHLRKALLHCQSRLAEHD